MQGWGLEVLCLKRRYSPILTAALMPEGHDADAFRKYVALDKVDISLGAGLSKLSGKVFGHLGECNELTLLGALAGVEMSACRSPMSLTNAAGVLDAMSALTAG